MILPPPRRYFPVDPSYRMPGKPRGLAEPGDDGTSCFEVDDELDRYRSAKRASPAVHHNALDDDEDRVVEWFESVLRREWPGLPRPAGFPARPGLDDVVSLVQEDVVVMRKESAQAADEATAAFLHVCFPSGWCPECAIGRNFEGIHRAVPESGTFTAGSRRNLAALLYRRAIRRFVWGLHADAALDQRACRDGHPCAPRTAWADATDAFLRVERQVVVPLDERLSVFLIRIYVYPLRSLATRQRALLHESVRVMEDRVAEYKGLLRDRERVLALLRG